MIILINYLGFSYKYLSTKYFILSCIVLLLLRIILSIFDDSFLIVLLYILYLLTIIDFRFNEVPYIYSFTFFLIVCIYLKPELISYIQSLLVLIPLLILDKVFSKILKVETSLGGGDILVLTISSLFLGLDFTYLSLFIGSLIGIFFIKFNRAFIPYLSIGIIISYILKGVIECIFCV